MAFLPDGRLAATGSWRTDLWDATTGRRLSEFAVHFGPYALALRPDGKLLATAEGPSLRVRETTPQAALRRAWTGGERAMALAVHPDGRSFVTGGGEDRRIRFWDMQTLTETLVLNEEPDRIITARYSPDGRHLAYFVRARTVKILELPRGNVVGEIGGISINGQPVAFHPNGKHLVVGRRNGTIVVRDLETQRDAQSLTAVGEQLWVAFSPDGRYMATTGRELAIRLWDAQTYEPIAELSTPGMGAPWCLSFSPDGDLLACGTWDRAVDLWDLRTRQRVASLAGHTALVTDVAFAPVRGRPILASASNDATLKIWDAIGQRCLATLQAESLDTYCVAFSRRSDAANIDDISDYLLLSVNLRGTVDVWDLGHYERHIAGNAERWIELARRQAPAEAGESLGAFLRDLQARASRPLR
jgi:WD40 repeat protein